MNGLSFLLIALVLSVAGSLVLWVRYRKPGSSGDAVAEFQREMQALAPDQNWQQRRPPSDEQR